MSTGYITREPQHLADASAVFQIREDWVPATNENDCCLEIENPDQQRQSTEPDRYPPCPDCGGTIVWAEAGGVPGSRRCVGKLTRVDEHFDPEAGCGSRFADSRYHAASAKHRCPEHPCGIN